MTFLDMKELETERLLLRRISKRDATDMYEYTKNPEASKYLTWSAHESLSYTTGYIKFLIKKYRKGEFFDWGIELKETKKMIGTCGFSVFDPNNKRVEIGYVLNPDYHNNGYATESVKRVVEYAFRELDIHRIELRIIDGNTASLRVAEKCGFKREGTAVDELIIKDSFKTIHHYALIRHG